MVVLKALTFGLLLLATNHALAAWPVVSENFIDEDLYQYRGSERLQGSYWDDHAGIDGARKSISITTGMTLTGARLKELARRGVQFDARDLTKISGANSSDSASYAGPRAGLLQVQNETTASVTPAFFQAPVVELARAVRANVVAIPRPAAATMPRPASVVRAPSRAPKTQASSAIRNLRMLQGR